MTIHNMKTLLTIVCLISMAKSFSAEQQRVLSFTFRPQGKVRYERCKFNDAGDCIKHEGCRNTRNVLRIVLSDISFQSNPPGLPVPQALVEQALAEQFRNQNKDLLQEIAQERGLDVKQLEIVVWRNK
ncbi:MAG: hypothetical protein EBU90_14110 [Proteobacteria bacterium]|nr:hypothetical protein [Pseudomonadota bacterium]NBP13858.1 hypothetical protein [bacterium]